VYFVGKYTFRKSHQLFSKIIYVLQPFFWRVSRFLYVYGRILILRLWIGAKFIHHHGARRPHQKLCLRWNWYDSWHNNPIHKYAHATIAAAWLIIAISIITFQYAKVRALSDLTDSWNFNNAADFSASNGIELNGSNASLKEQEYAADANTVALYHFNENSGNNASDSSDNHNDATITNSSFGSGNLNNALSLNGTTSRVEVPNSASLGITQHNSLEAWTKFNTPFDKNTNDRRQGIVDKGDYQFYFDNETGKLTYELADKNATSWSLAAGNDTKGSWDANGKRSANVLVKMGNDIYAGIGVDTGDAEVWKWDGNNWTQIGGGPGSINNSWDGNTYEGVFSITTDGSNIYAGLGNGTGDAEVWKWNGNTWAKIGGDSLNNGWTNYAEGVYSMDFYNGKLYAGLGYSANDAEVWEWNGASWNQIGGDSKNGGWTTNFESVMSITNDGTDLYVGIGISANDAEVWKWDGSTWAKIGGDSLNNGWTTNYETVRSLKHFGGNLYAGLGDSANDAEVWKWDGSSWSKIGGDAVNGSWSSNYEQIGGFAWDGSNLYTGLGTTDGDGEVYKWNGSSWSKIGGDAVNGSWVANQGDTVNALLFDSGKLFAATYDSAGEGMVWTYNGTSWTEIAGTYINNSWGYYGVSAVQVMQYAGDYLYAGLGNTNGSALCWRFDGNSWELIGGQGINNSWAPNTYEAVISMASFKGNLYVGLGSSANDAEVWKWDGNTWSKVGGDSLNNGWAANYEEVDSMAATSDYLYAGLGTSTADGEVWRFDGTNWSKIGGDSINNGWTNYADSINSMAIYNHKLYAGLGRSTGEAEIWEWNGSSWSKVGGDGVGNSWNTTTYQEVDALMPYNGKLFAGIGNIAGSGTLWEWDGSSWTKIGGDDVNGSWTTGAYERVKTIAVYNGDLYVGLGASAGDGEVWRYRSGTWTKIGGASMNGGWNNTVEEIESMSAYKGKFYVGTGLSQNADGLIWSWGNNAFLQSDTTNFDNNWHHVVGTYDGSNMKIYIDGNLDATTEANVLLPTAGRVLLIGTTYGGREYGKPVGTFDGQIDELRISNIARGSFTSKPYPTAKQTVQPINAIRKNGVWHWDELSENASGGGSVTYRLSDDEGNTWKYWNGSEWAESNNLDQANSAIDITSHISVFPVTFKGILWQAILQGDGSQKVTLDNVSLESTSDLTTPSSSSVTIDALKAHGGSVLNSGSWTNGSSPSFSWNAGNDNESGVKGYCLYLGSDALADPVTAKGLLGNSGSDAGGNCQFMVNSANADLATSGYVATSMTSSNDKYYLIAKTIDKAGNVSTDSATFEFKFDNTPPTTPGFISAPSGFVNNKAVTLSWATSGGSAPDDNHSGLDGLQYRIGSNGIWYGDNHSGSGDQSDLLSNSGSYTMQDPPDFANLSDGVNTVYFRTFDKAGNVSQGFATAAIKLNTSGAPSEPQNLIATPSVNTTNSFNFHWDAPVTFVGDENNLTYCYTVNVEPDANSCTFTGAGITSLASGPFATKPGTNTLYVVAKDESNNINYDSFSTVEFTANTTAPGIPINADIVDVSIKATSNWRLALTWDVPSNVGAGVAKYNIYRSSDNQNFSSIGTSSSTTYIDAGLQQHTYYYRVKACDNTNNCGAWSTSVNALPTGKFTEPAEMVSEPIASDITTKKATISWSTDRGSDSKIALGTTSGHYGASEISNSDQVSSHTIKLDNLAAGTTYYYVAKWTDEDGNTGSSQEYTFRTAPPPTIKEADAASIGLSNATILFTSKNAVKVAVYYGASESFGGVKMINTSFEESTYSVNLDGLNDGTKYFFKLVSFDSEGNAYEGNVQSFTTPPRPRITNLRFQPVSGKPTSTQKITWTTNVPSTTGISYGIVGTTGTESQISQAVTEHEIEISDLIDDSEYFLLAQSRDGNGNLATSDRQVFHTALDTRPPKVTNITVESSIRGTGAEARGQIVVSWRTDEPATSQVAYAEGSGVSVFNTKTAEDGGLSFEHIVIVSDLPTSRVYSIQPISNDKARNTGSGKTQTAIIGRASDSVLTIILDSLKGIFGF